MGEGIAVPQKATLGTVWLPNPPEQAGFTARTRAGGVGVAGAAGSHTGPANYLSLLVNRTSMTGMVVFDYADRYAEVAREMAPGCLQAS